MWKALLRRCLPAGALVLSGILVQSASAQTSDNLLLVVNDNSPASIEIASYYAAKRQVAADHIVHIQAPVSDAIERVAYVSSIEAPIAAALSRFSLQDRVLYVVLSKGVPLRIAGTTDRDGTLASVDSELTLLYRKLTGLQPSLLGRIDNPYYLGNAPIADAAPFSRRRSDIYLVTRLDGFTVEDVQGLIDRGVSPGPNGTVVLEQRAASGAEPGGDQWLGQAFDRLRQMNAGDRTLLDTGPALASTQEPVIGYYSWGSNDAALQARRTGLTFAPGAIGAMFVGTGARTFAEPPADWVPTIPGGRGRPFAGTFESLAGDLVRDGLTGVGAAVAEPFLDATIRPQILLPAYVAGFNLAESFYLATPFLSWRTVIVGDPLCRPFPRTALTPAEISDGIDPETELPALFAARRLQALSSLSDLKSEALKLWLKIGARVNQGNTDDIEALLVQTTAIEPRFSAAQQRLAELYDTKGDYAQAIDRYRRALAADPQNAIALNNLAYALAVRQMAPAEALPLAERAYALAPDARIADTVGWIHHLLGNDRQALPYLERAVSDRPTVDGLIHAATVYALLGERTKATEALAGAEKLDGAISERADVKALRQRLAPGPAAGLAPATSTP